MWHKIKNVQKKKRFSLGDVHKECSGIIRGSQTLVKLYIPKKTSNLKNKRSVHPDFTRTLLVYAALLKVEEKSMKLWIIRYGFEHRPKMSTQLINQIKLNICQWIMLKNCNSPNSISKLSYMTFGERKIDFCNP